MRTHSAFLLVVAGALTLSSWSNCVYGQEDLASRTFLRADANADGRLNLRDPIGTLLRLIFRIGRFPCLDAADSNDDGRVGFSDAIYTLNFLFGHGRPIPPPGHEKCGRDPTPDRLGCREFDPCPMFCGGLLGTRCERGQFCERPPGFCHVADLPGECVDIPDACPEIFDPVCGCDGVTYSNDCERRRAGVQKDRDGPCRKVCGGFAGSPCEKWQFCERPPGFCGVADVPGECVDIPEACPDNFDPVCGCDGVTYSNDCERRAAGAQKDHDGPCRKVCGGFAGVPCARGQFCDLPPGLCDGADLQGECVDLPHACPAIFDPVCGCDGVTYANDCVRQGAGVQKDHDGPCRDTRPELDDRRPELGR